MTFRILAGDELIDMEEYTAVYTSYGLAKEDCEKAFDKFSNVSSRSFAFQLACTLKLDTTKSRSAKWRGTLISVCVLMPDKKEYYLKSAAATAICLKNCYNWL